MKCENDYCIYNENSICTLDEITIDSCGGCRQCILVSIPESELRRLKQKQLSLYERE